MHEEASRVLARAFVTNPMHVAVFGPDRLARNEAFFYTALGAMKGRSLVALDGERIVGLVHWVHSPLCQFSVMEKVRHVPRMLTGFGSISAMKVNVWLAAWSKRDPQTPHTHLGPIGVAPEAQGSGVGQRLMEEYSHELDRTGAAGYLETDRSENVRFYRRFGFVMVHEIDVLGVRNYLMWRAGK
ncbi:MAG TPA: GNAT family N-acetyltransferase [Vicinamibacterales bacterium]|jgi:ribosomal protein S18 acetylase RimI-like enzyme